MKKLATTLLAVSLAAATVLTGCSVDEAKLQYLKDFDATKYVELGEYKGMEITVPKADEVTDATVEETISTILAYYPQRVEVTDRDTAQNGDVTDIKYVGTVDGVEFEGGSADSYFLTLGSGQFIDGFEDGVIGMKVGETKDLNLKFPEAYGSADLAGKDAVFTVTLNGIYTEEVPELTDEIVSTIDPTLSNVAEFKESVKESLIEDAASMRENAVEEAIITKLSEISTVNSIPSGFSARVAATLMENVNEAAASYQMDPATIAQYYYGVDPENFQQGINDFVNNTVGAQYMIIGAIAKKEGFEISDEELDKLMQEEIDEYGATYTLDEYKEIIGDLESYREYLLVEKVVKFIADNAVINEE